MKRILLLCAATTALSFTAASFADAFDSAIQFKEMKQQQKTDWLKFAAEQEKEKNEIISDQMKDWSSLSISKIQEIKNLQPGKQEEFIKTMLEKAVALYEKHGKKMSEFWMKKNEQGKALYEKHLKAFQDFLKKAGMLPEKKNAEQKETAPALKEEASAGQKQ